MNSKGKVYLVGAGPGDPKLITIRGMECIKEADVIIYDYLANKKLIYYSKKEAEIIPVNKRGHKDHLDIEKICSLMKDKVKSGKIVTRLKGGDPFVFGRGGEEAEWLSDNNIPFEVVPGVTSAIAASAYAGIPVTHRKFSSTLTFITGHKSCEGKIDWDKISCGQDTLIFYMSLSNLDFIQKKLISKGKSKNTEVAVISCGTTHGQITVTGTLSTIVNNVNKAKLKAPAIVVMGDVVKLRNKLQWFDIKPLFGKKIIITRAKDQSAEFTELLENEGAEVIEFPTIEIVPVSDYSKLDEAIENISRYNWLIFTSVNGVKYFFDRLKNKEKDIRIISNIKICAIGPKTGEEIEKKGLKIDYLPEEYKAEGIITEFEKLNIKNLKILIPRAEEAREILPIRLAELGAEVHVIPVYKNILPIIDINDILEELKNKMIDIITFTSSSTINNFIEIFAQKNIKIVELLKNCKVACIGPITKETAFKSGIQVDIVPKKYTISDLVFAIKDYYKIRGLLLPTSLGK
ncbi:MAG: uroporphyrinogen-III C-methyltransferase [Candidatus Firestonebacteria bacterium]|nr:uroporphyrinogen-III C-methyltransferase [Candidatus Firestonebacteria bacterium]